MPEVAEKVGEDEQRLKEKTIVKADTRERREEREEELVKQDTGLVLKEMSNKENNLIEGR